MMILQKKPRWGAGGQQTKQVRIRHISHSAPGSKAATDLENVKSHIDEI
jgi:hypothetical protein